MRALLLLPTILAVALFSCVPALACEDHYGRCELDAWRANYEKSMNTLFFDASATCNSGRATIRLYDGDRFLGVLSRSIRGHALRGTARIDAYSNLKIKYSIEPR